MTQTVQEMRTTATTLLSRRLTALIVAIAAGGAAWILVRTWHGAGISPDSAWYLSAAENLAAGNGLVNFKGERLHWFAPGYPISLAGFELVGIGAHEGGRWLNAVAFGATIGISGLWLKGVCRSPAIVLAGVLTVACSRSFHYSAVRIHSESLYLLLTVGSLILVSKFLKHPEQSRRAQELLSAAGLWMLPAAGLLAGLSAAVRYVGAVAAASSFLLLLFWRPERRPAQDRLQAATIFGLAAALPVVVVLARNVAGTGDLLGQRLGSSTGDSVLGAIETIISIHASGWPSFVIPWVMLVAAALIFWTASGRDRPRSLPRRLGIESSAPFAAFVLLYAATLVLAQPWNSGPIVPRLWLPAAVALLFVGCETLDTAIDRSASQALGDSRLSLLLAATGAVVVLALAASSLASMRNVRAQLSIGHPAGVVVSGIVESPVIAHLQQHPTDDLVYSNRPAGAYVLTGIQPTLQLPAWRAGERSLTGSECLGQLASLARGADDPENTRLRIAWFDEIRTGDIKEYCDIEALASVSAELELVEEFPDGAIYRFEPSP